MVLPELTLTHCIIFVLGVLTGSGCMPVIVKYLPSSLRKKVIKLTAMSEVLLEEAHEVSEKVDEKSKELEK